MKATERIGNVSCNYFKRTFKKPVFQNCLNTEHLFALLTRKNIHGFLKEANDFSLFKGNRWNLPTAYFNVIFQNQRISFHYKIYDFQIHVFELITILRDREIGF